MIIFFAFTFANCVAVLHKSDQYYEFLRREREIKFNQRPCKIIIRLGNVGRDGCIFLFIIIIAIMFPSCVCVYTLRTGTVNKM